MTLEELVALCRQALAAQKIIGELEEKTQREQAKLNRLEQELIPEIMLGLGLTSFTADDMVFDLKKAYKARLTEAKTEAALAYLAANGFGGMIKAQLLTEVGASDAESIAELLEILSAKGLSAFLKNTIHPNTLASFVREQDEAGQLTDEMKDLLSVYTQYSVKVKEKK